MLQDDSYVLNKRTSGNELTLLQCIALEMPSSSVSWTMRPPVAAES